MKLLNRDKQQSGYQAGLYSTIVSRRWRFSSFGGSKRSNTPFQASSSKTLVQLDDDRAEERLQRARGVPPNGSSPARGLAIPERTASVDGIQAGLCLSSLGGHGKSKDTRNRRHLSLTSSASSAPASASSSTTSLASTAPSSAPSPSTFLTSDDDGDGAACVRFGAITVHHIEKEGLPTPRDRLPCPRSKSGFSYLNPPVDQDVRQIVVEFVPGPGQEEETLLRRHHERQAAMARYWLRTEEEEAIWRAEARRLAAEETARYRREPAEKWRPADGVLGS